MAAQKLYAQEKGVKKGHCPLTAGRRTLWTAAFLVVTLAVSSVASAQGKDPLAAKISHPILNQSGSVSWSKVVSLAHELNTSNPLFPGDPPFTTSIWNTIAADGYLLELISTGTHTGTHVSAPCHFIEGAKCMADLPAEMFIRPAVVIDVRERVAQNPDFQLSKADIRAWEQTHGKIPAGAIVILFTGFGSRYFDPSYFGTAPGFSSNAVRWLMKPVGQGGRGCAGTGSDTFGPDATSDTNFSATYYTLLAGGVTIENLTNLEQVHDQGDTIVFLPARFQGSGYQTNVIALVH